MRTMVADVGAKMRSGLCGLLRRKPRSRKAEALLLALILLVGAVLRFYGLNWDGGHWSHPDERQVYFVVNGLGWPQSLAEALTPASPLNPGFFAYGSLTFYVLKLAIALLSPLWPAIRDPGEAHLVGRLLAGLADLGTVYLTYHLARTVCSSGEEKAIRWIPLFSAALVSLCVLHVQAAHFYTADVLLVVMIMLTLNCAARVAQRGGQRYQVALGVAMGLALATKISAAPLFLSVVAACSLRPAGTESAPKRGRAQLGLLRSAALRSLAPTLGAAVATFLVAEPYAVIDWRSFVADTLRESQIAWGALDVPYTRQYAGTWPYLYSMWQTALWAMGLPLGMAAWLGLASTGARWLRWGSSADTLLMAWAGPYLGLVGLLHTRYLRYMLPLLPLLCLMAARLMGQLKWRRLRLAACSAVAIGTLGYAVVFVSIYTIPHPWIQASEWIYRQVAPGSVLAVEEWDTALPLPIDVDGQPRRIEEYRWQVLDLYREPDNADKWASLARDIAASDYLVLASRRLYGSIPRMPERYGVSSRYYDLLFAGNLGFELAAEFTRGPTWLNPPIPPLPNAAPALARPDESFVVYDHPRTLVFRNVGRLSAGELLGRLGVW